MHAPILECVSAFRRLSGAINVVPELSDDPSEAAGFSGGFAAPAPAPSQTESGVLKSRKKRQETMAKNAEKRTDPNRCREAGHACCNHATMRPIMRRMGPPVYTPCFHGVTPLASSEQ